MPETDIIDDTREFLDLKAEIKSLKSEIKRLKADVGRAQARSEIAVSALAAGVPPESLEDVVSRSEKAGWVMKDGRSVQVDDKGEQKSNIGHCEWIKSLRTNAAHLFAQTETPEQYAPPGTTAQQPGNGDLKPGEPNPWVEATWNDTAQARIILLDRAKADRLAAAGTYVGALPRNLRRS